MDEQGGQIPVWELDEVLGLTQDPGEQVGEMEEEEGVNEGAVAAESAGAQNGGASHVAARAEPAAPMDMNLFMMQLAAGMEKLNDKMDAQGDKLRNELGS